MAIIFHEGLPGNGKSYAAMKTIIEQLEKGRAVRAYMEGLNFQKIADHISKPIEYVETLLKTVKRDDVKEIHSLVENDEFVVIDEVQNFWPVGREKLSPGMMQFVTEHRHRGLDILIMGQDHRDCHNLWKRRIDKKIYFTKLDALGLSSRYRWTAAQQIAGKWKDIGGKTEKYDSRYFGLYASHEAATENKETYQDKRLTIWKQPGFKYGVPAVLIALYFSINFLSSFFTPAEADVQIVKPVKHLQHVASVKPTAFQAIPPDPVIPLIPVTFIGKLISSYRPRISGYIERGDKFFGYVDFLDGSFHVKERLTIESITALGWSVERKSFGIIMTKDKETHIVTAWPIDPFGSVSQQTRASPALTASPSVASAAVMPDSPAL